MRIFLQAFPRALCSFHIVIQIIHFIPSLVKRFYCGVFMHTSMLDHTGKTSKRFRFVSESGLCAAAAHDRITIKIMRVFRTIVCAGGLLDEEGKAKGSALIMEFPDRAALDAYLASEPYVVEHVWDRVEVETMNVVILDGKM